MSIAIAIIGRRHEPDVLNFLIDGVLQKFVKLLNLLFDLADVREFDFDGCAETVTAELRQTELLAIIGTEFDGHDVRWWWDEGTKKPDLVSLADRVVGVVLIYAACASTGTSLGLSSASFRVVA